MHSKFQKWFLILFYRKTCLVKFIEFNKQSDIRYALYVTQHLQKTNVRGQ